MASSRRTEPDRLVATIERAFRVEGFEHEEDWLDARDAAVKALAELIADRDSWQKVAREYESVLADRGLL